MQLIIVEGTDNSGKDTLIKNLCETFKDRCVETFHFEKPKSKTNEECAKEQDESFLNFVKSLDSSNDKMVILNRAWYGELVYGTLYRGRTKDDVLHMIWECEKILLDNKIDTTYIFLCADPNFSAKNDDGKSLSNGDPIMIENELLRFIKAFKKSLLTNKVFIEVNNENGFVPQEEILKTALKYIR